MAELAENACFRMEINEFFKGMTPKGAYLRAIIFQHQSDKTVKRRLELRHEAQQVVTAEVNSLGFLRHHQPTNKMHFIEFY